MKVFLGLLSVVGLIAGLPTAPRTSPGEPDECSKECINGVIQYGHDLSILKHSDLSNYFNKIDEICEVISTARKCLESCGSTTKSGNPFALESLNIVCQPETQEKIDSIKQCLHYIDSNVNEICTKECGSDRIIDETDVTPAKPENPMIQKANSDCATFKCMARCNVEAVSNQCGKDHGKEFQGLLQQVLDAQRRDLEGLKLVDAMAKESPAECNYLYDPSVLFGSSKTEESSSPAPSETHDPKEDAKTLYAQAQLQLLLKQLELTEKQDQLIDRENAKLDMEMSYMAHKAEQRENRFHAAQHSIPTFVPMEKMPKEHMPMEPLEASHPEPMPTESHPPMEEAHSQQQPEEPQPEQMEAHPPMEESPSPPEEPHHEQMPMEAAHPPMPMEEGRAPQMPSMESHQPQMPMESQPPMNFPHPEAIHGMPMEMNPEMPRHKSSRHSMPPMILEGVPMEFVPMDGIPIELPMHMPMEAMPRFI
jgi:hypothetical protein